jgi:hypothetical protein
MAAAALRGHGSFAGPVTFTPLGGDLVGLEINAQGNATHLGKSRVRIHSRADTSGAVPQPVPPTTGAITAANGDMVSFTTAWSVEELSPGVFRTFGPLQITGGTGRFSNASGGGQIEGIVDAQNARASATATWTLVR